MPEEYSYTQDELDQLRAVAAARLLSHREPLDAFDIVAMDRAIGERIRQVTAEGWSREHDDHHTEGELARAAACYAEPPELREGWDVGPTGLEGLPGNWPWEREAWKPTAERLREIDKAIALLFAEGARIMRERARAT